MDKTVKPYQGLVRMWCACTPKSSEGWVVDLLRSRNLRPVPLTQSDQVRHNKGTPAEQKQNKIH